MSAYFVAGAGTDIGKTHVGCALLEALRARGAACAAFKPVLSGFDPEHARDSDSARLLRALGQSDDADAIAAISPWRFRAPLSPPDAARAEGAAIPFTAVVEACRAKIAAAPGVLLIEGAGGVMSPLTARETFLDLAAALPAPVLLIAGSYLGAISHALTAHAALRGAGLSVAALIVNQSRDGAGVFADTLAAVRAFVDAPVFATRWGGDTAAELAPVADLLLR